MMYDVGNLIDDRYLVTRTLGQGGHGTVYAALDEMLGAHVAIKCLNPLLAEDAAFKIRMHREARAMGALSGTSAVQIFAFNRSKEGALYIVMELLKGRDLEAYCRELDGHGATIDLTRLIDLLAPIAYTLDTAHGIGIIHRDLKPANIFVLDDFTRGGVRLLDFGLAKDLKAEAFTREGTIAGSPGYIAPEVWQGKAHEADRTIDVYALGAVVFRCLAGRPPFDPRQPIDALLLAVTRGERPSLVARRPDLPRALDDWMQKALAIKKEDRFPSVGKAWQALRDVAALPARPLSTPEPGPPSASWEVEIDVEIEEEVSSLRGPS
jgi:serine/threonine protein kinase